MGWAARARQAHAASKRASQRFQELRMSKMDGLVAGRIVYFVIDHTAAADIARQRIGTGGNPVAIGDVYPAMVVKVWEGTIVNLKVMLDGPDTYWATSVQYDEWTPGAESLPTPRTWHWMFSGQAGRYTPAPAAKPAADALPFGDAAPRDEKAF